MNKAGISEEFKSLHTADQYESFIQKYLTDERGGVQKKIAQARKEISAYEAECERTERMVRYEHE